LVIGQAQALPHKDGRLYSMLNIISYAIVGIIASILGAIVLIFLGRMLNLGG